MNRLAALGLTLFLSACAAPGVDLLVVAPHPDDESIGCGAILAEAWALGRQARVLVVTNGDGNRVSAAALAKKAPEQLASDDYLAVARLRQGQALAAVAALGGTPGDVVFLGYPDTELQRLYETRSDVPVTQALTGRRETYGLARPDYRTAASGRPAPYTHASLRSDLEALLRALRPRRLYVTHPSDGHADHRAAFAFVRDAARAVGYRGELYAYVVHGTPPEGAEPPSTLSPVALQAKTRAIDAYLAGFPPESEPGLAKKRESFAAYARREERFWRIRLDR